MKKLALIASFLILNCAVAFAVTRNNSKVPTTLTLTGGYEVVGNGSKSVTTAGTAVQVSATSVPCARTTICASTDNTGVIAIGSSTVKAAGSGRSGITLSKNDCISLDHDNLNTLYIDSTVSGESVNYVYQEYV